ncbi:MAG: hypothetical protein D3M94_06650 [Rhodocyclales bacterium GT-UBC]|nr:MAG: hypothetical protein D3M94_06650 [Rhodocyclales bacterium GT-UBC]
MIDYGFTAFVFLIAILVAVGGSLVLVGYLGTLPASFNFGWRVWGPTLLLPPFGPLWFAWQRRAEFKRPGLQLLAGLLLLLIAGAILYQGGPLIVDRMAAGVK